MDEQKRLELIVEAVKYCQRVSRMGMPVSSYTKELREPIYFLWELRGGRGKDICAQFRSKATVGMRRGTGTLIYDHAIPFRFLQDELLKLPEVTPESVADVLSRHCIAVLVTKEEDALLGNKMPEDWDGIDPLARYKKADIEVVPNSLPPAQPSRIKARSGAIE